MYLAEGAGDVHVVGLKLTSQFARKRKLPTEMIPDIVATLQSKKKRKCVYCLVLL